MKQINITIFLSLCLQCSYANISTICQTTASGCSMIPLNGIDITTLVFDHDTIIKGHEYYFSSNEPTKFVRQEGRQILLWDEKDMIDLLLYDFSLVAGDSLPIIYTHYNHNTGAPEYYDYQSYVNDNDDKNNIMTYWYIKDVGTYTDLQGRNRIVQFTEGLFGINQIVEGIGDVKNGLFYPISHTESTCAEYTFLMCHTENGELIYQESKRNLEYYNLTQKDCHCSYNDNTKVAFDTFVDGNYLTISIPIGEYIHQILIYDILGRLVDLCFASSINYDITLPQGIYCISVITNKAKYSKVINVISI